MGFLDKMLEKQETKGSERYVQVLNQIRPDFEAALTKIQCNEGNGFFHTGFVIKIRTGKKLYYHRCRNTWMGSDGNLFQPAMPIGAVPVTSDPVAALEHVLSSAAYIEGLG
jgi:hypothetical protein